MSLKFAIFSLQTNTIKTGYNLVNRVLAIFKMTAPTSPILNHEDRKAQWEARFTDTRTFVCKLTKARTLHYILLHQLAYNRRTLPSNKLSPPYIHLPLQTLASYVFYKLSTIQSVWQNYKLKISVQIKVTHYFK